MHLTAQVKLLPTPEQSDALRRTLETANAASEWLSKKAWQSKTFGQYDLHHLCYRECRSQFGLSAQMTVRCIAKVSDAYKLDRLTRRRFKPTGSIAYDDRIFDLAHVRGKGVYVDGSRSAATPVRVWQAPAGIARSASGRK